MIKVLVVEDDKLARKGLIHAMPWADFGMVVVGEASNGQAALDFLAAREVDLMLTDYAMPGMTGGELMRKARDRFPALRCVVLTFHQELEYAQEAIRLGAIDYVAKVQLEKEGFDEVLRRIRERFMEERPLPASYQSESSLWFAADRAYVLLSIDEGSDSAWIARLPGPLVEGLVEIEAGLWLWEPRGEGQAGSALPTLLGEAGGREGWGVLELRGLYGESKSRVVGALRRYRRGGYFFDYDGRAGLLPRSLPELDAPPEAPPDAGSEAEPDEIERRLLACEWIYDDADYDRVCEAIVRARPPIGKLLRLLVQLEAEWNRIFSPIASRRIRIPEALRSWGEVRSWLDELRNSAFAGNARLSYAKEVVSGVMRAVKIVDEELVGPLFAIDVARRVNMSRGYFCRCFKGIVGKPFNDYLRQARVEKAKLLLIHTDAPIHQIAEQVGYADEKYFSSVFREQAGVLPSGFRQARREGRRQSSVRGD